MMMIYIEDPIEIRTGIGMTIEMTGIDFLAPGSAPAMGLGLDPAFGLAPVFVQASDPGSTLAGGMARDRDTAPEPGLFAHTDNLFS